MVKRQVAYDDPGPIRFRAAIKSTGRGGCYVEFPHDVEELYGVKGRVPVRATFDGVAYRGSLMKIGGACHMMPLLKEIRQQLGKGEGDEVEVVVELDDAPREVELPAAFRTLLDANADCAAFFEKLSFSHQREYVRWIESAKREQTRVSRMERALEMLRAGQREPRG